MRHFILVIVLWFFSFNVFGDDSARYGLHRPTATEYLTIIATQAHLWHQPIEDELIREYPDLSDQDYALVDQAYQAILSFSSYDDPSIDHAYWITNLTRSWLAVQNIDLSQHSSLKIGDAAIALMPIDFDGDGQDEYGLHYINPLIEGFVFVKVEGDGQYTVVPAPFQFWNRPLEDPYAEEMAEDELLPMFYTPLSSQDFTQDGFDDFAVLFQAEPDDYGSERLYILSWKNGTVVDAGDHKLSFANQFPVPTWEIVEADIHDGAVIEQTRELHDNWQCGYTRTTVYGWNGSAVTQIDYRDTFPESPLCYLRFAEEAMWEEKYDEAITLYQRYFNADHRSDYARLRLAIALVMSDQIDAGIALMNALKTELEGVSWQTLAPMVNQMLAAYANNPTKMALCLAAYDYMVWNPNAVWYTETREVGQTIDEMVYDSGTHTPRPSDPARAGCAFSRLLQDQLDRTTFVTAASPLDQLAKLGLFTEITYQDDLNEDGITDWLVWIPTIRVAPIFFLSDSDLYQISRPDISEGYPINAQNTLTTIHLPDESGLALLNVDFSEHFIGYPVGWGIGVCEADGDVTLWRLTGYEITNILSAPLCAEVEPNRVVDRINGVQEIYAWSFAYGVGDSYYIPITYQWDSASQTFVIPPSIQMTLTPPPINEDSSASRYSLRWSNPSDLYEDGEYETIIALRDEAIVTPDIDLEELLSWRYMAARAYEAVGRLDEAIAEYAAVYETDIPSDFRYGWIHLAGLHLEAVQD